MIDAMRMSLDTIRPLDDIAFVRLVDCMPRLVPEGQTADQAVVQAARNSYGDGTKTITEDRGLIRYLFRHMHTTPVEMVETKWHMKMPIFVARQFIRHRTASVNEVSGRYSVLKDEFCLLKADAIRAQSKKNKQGSDGQIADLDAQDFAEIIEAQCVTAYAEYERALANGVTREQARVILPLNIYTEWYWKIDAHNLFHFLGLRCDSHAQYEIRVFADAMLELLTPVVPWCVEAWNDYHHLRAAVKLSRLEVEAIMRHMSGIPNRIGQILSDNKREREEWVERAKRLGFEVGSV